MKWSWSSKANHYKAIKGSRELFYFVHKQILVLIVLPTFLLGIVAKQGENPTVTAIFLWQCLPIILVC